MRICTYESHGTHSLVSFTFTQCHTYTQRQEEEHGHWHLLTCRCLIPPLRVNAVLEWRIRLLLSVSTSPGWGRFSIYMIPRVECETNIYVTTYIMHGKNRAWWLMWNVISVHERCTQLQFVLQSTCKLGEDLTSDGLSQEFIANYINLLTFRGEVSKAFHSSI